MSTVAEADAFYAGAHSRIVRNMVLLGLALTVTALAATPWRTALGLFAGFLVAIVNFLWLGRFVDALGNRSISSGTHNGGGAGFILRYSLIGLLAYVIFKSSVVSFPSFLAGLFLPVPAILLEAAYETYMAVRRGY